MALWMAGFFLFFTAFAWLGLFPAAREGALNGAGRVVERLASRLGHWITSGVHMVRRPVQWLSGMHEGAIEVIRRHRSLAMLTLVLLSVPPAVVVVTQRSVEGVPSTQLVSGWAPDAHVLGLLRGEQLAPPPELPPEVFTSADARRVAPGIATADRKWERLDPDFKQRLLTVFRVMRERHGYEMALVEGYRSPERQARLAARGAHVTLAGAGRSWHQYGLAADAAPLRSGALQWDMQDPWTRRGYQLYGEVAREAGLVWGGGWTRIKDYGHVELRRQGVRPAAGQAPW